jgi:hypothetical protein
MEGNIMRPNRLLPIVAILIVMAAKPASTQSLDDLNIQIHGYATQGFLYTTNNNIFTTTSSNGSPAWTETVLNVTSQPMPKLRIGVQGRYFLLGNYGNAITLDWAAADYKANDRFGVRFGKVKTPSGLLNEVQDIDPSYMWSLLPQGIYPIASRNSLLSHYGGVVYGTMKLGQKAGKLEYRGWGGVRSIASNDGYFVSLREEGIDLPNGLSEVIDGIALHWKTPLSGLMLGASVNHGNKDISATTLTVPTYGTFSGTLTSLAGNIQQYFGRYEKDRLMIAGEYERAPANVTLNFPGFLTEPSRVDYRSWYAMATYKLIEKLSAGLYDTQFVNRQGALGPTRDSFDWVFSGRYDFNQYLYAKAEQHFMAGTANNLYDTTLNADGLKPTTKLTILKIGVSF